MTTMIAYQPPTVTTRSDLELLENELPVFVAAIGWVVLVFGSAFAYCKAMCGWNNVKECSAGWLQVKAICKG